VAQPAPLPAQLPPPLSGLDPAWSRLVDVPELDGNGRTFHVLDSYAHRVGPPELTVMALHGNPSWSYLWRNVLAAAPDGVRVLAPDHLDMGYSERTGSDRSLADRIGDLCALTDALGVDGPVITLAHDWGGPISMGWAQRHVNQLRGVVLANTAVSQPADGSPPKLITTAGSAALLRTVTERTTTFIRAGLALSRPRMAPETRQGLLAPYRTADRRTGIRAFVADIPLDERHPSYETLDNIATGMSDLAHVPALLLWGTRDPVFSEQYLHDLEERLPHADVHRFVGASHFVTEDAPVADAFWDWVKAEDRPVRSALHADGPLLPTDLAVAPLVVERHQDAWSRIDSSDFTERTGRVARGLARAGVKPGDRVATMIPPGIDLTVVLYACWEAGFTAVLVDGGLGVGTMHRAIKAAAPQWLIGIPRAVAASKALRWNGTRIVAGDMDGPVRACLGVAHSLREIELMGKAVADLAPPATDNPAVVGFTSGSTGPSKGVQYRAAQLAAQRDAIKELYQIDGHDRLVAAFAPFALYGPALGIASVVPEMDVTRPSTLTASALGAAAAEVDATIIFASPAALQNVVATAGSMSPAERVAVAKVRLVMSAGAPLRLDLLQAVAELAPEAEIRAPYGMTEVLPVADLSLVERVARGHGEGSCVGRPIQGVSIRIHPLDSLGIPATDATEEDGVLGEVVVSAPHLKERYDRLWWTEHRSLTQDGWHRTGDIGRVDRDGFLWISGRVQHVIATATGPVAPIPIEHAAERVDVVDRAAAVGVGPAGAQVIAVVVEVPESGRNPLADPRLAESVRHQIDAAGASRPAAVLVTRHVPVDKRHNSKVDRTRIARWAERVLAGDRPGRL
jgi:acyl-CoA synthetase (AMP-forming)/AMP-acid ligase II/pimeloyl-ACP methyl ester carboxylesterase